MASAPSNAALIDWNILSASRIELGANFVRILGYFREDGEKSVAAIEDAMRSGNAAAMVIPAHTLKGESATEENLAFVGKQVMQAKQTGPSEWKGSLTAGGISADATVTQTGPDTVDIQGCRAAVLCKTLAYNRAS